MIIEFTAFKVRCDSCGEIFGTDQFDELYFPSPELAADEVKTADWKIDEEDGKITCFDCQETNHDTPED